MARFPIKRSDNKWVSTALPVCYWIDKKGKSRLTDQSAVLIGCEVKAVYQHADAIPQDIVDQIISANKVDSIKLTLYKEGSVFKLTDEIKLGKIISVSQKTLSSKTAAKNNAANGLFGSNKIKNTPFVTIKLFDGSQYWENGMVAPPYYNANSGQFAYYSQWVGIPDQFYVPHYRIDETGERKLGKFIRETIEVIEDFPGYEPGIYIYGHSSGTSSGAYAGYIDGRYHYAHVNRGTYEQLMAGIYENRFDVVLSTNGSNIYNKQLGTKFLKELDIGVEIGIDTVCVLTNGVSGNQEYVSTMPPDAKIDKIDDAIGLYDAFGKPYDRNWSDRENKDRLDYVGVAQIFSNTDEILHLSFTDRRWGIFCGFNTSDKDNFCMSKNKGEYNTHTDILIPKNSNPTIEVILVPLKWKYFIWVLGEYADAGSPYRATPKWNASSFIGTAPTVYGKAGGFFSAGDPGGIGWNSGGLAIFGAWSGATAAPMDYTKYGYLATPSGRVFGPIYNDAYIEDIVFGSLTHAAKARKDSLGQSPIIPFQQQSRYWAPGYSAWAQPYSEGQLVSIIRILYDNGAVDYRYVYATKESTDEPTLRAYASAAQPFGTMVWFGNMGGYIYYHDPYSPDLNPAFLVCNTENNFSGMQYFLQDWYANNARETWRWNYVEGAYDWAYSDAQYLSLYNLMVSYDNPPVVESVIDAYYQNLYKKISAEYLKGLVSNDQYITNHGPVLYNPPYIP